jgi:hypothetical protein
VHHVALSLCLFALGCLSMSEVAADIVCLRYRNFIHARATTLFLHCRLGAFGQHVNGDSGASRRPLPMSVCSGMFINE